MKRFAFLLLFVASCAMASAQQSAEPVLKAGATVAYPTLARFARIQGDVVLEFTLNANGSVVNCTVLSGHPMLVSAAESAVQGWKFTVPNGIFKVESKFRTTFHFQLVKGAEYSILGENGRPETLPPAIVQLDSFHDVWGRAIEYGSKFADKCPAQHNVVVPETRTASDYVRLERGGYAVTVWAHGKVEWEGHRGVEIEGRREGQIDQREARALISRFGDRRFWSLCDHYTDNGSDGWSYGTTAEIGGLRKEVTNHDDSAPSFVTELEDAIDEAADTHQWRHGEPSVEPISRISDDLYSQKRGKTRLMTATVMNDPEKLDRFLKAGDDPNAQDPSGWSVLMYAAISGHSDSVQRLLKAGADPNHRSTNGDTPLMVSAFLRLDEDLVVAGAEIDAQNKDGVTALMMLATRSAADDIEAALKAGANAKLKDSKGRTALDYLSLAICGRSPLNDEKMEWIHTEYGECNALNNEQVNRTKKLLSDAMSRR